MDSVNEAKNDDVSADCNDGFAVPDGFEWGT